VNTGRIQSFKHSDLLVRSTHFDRPTNSTMVALQSIGPVDNCP